MKLVRIIFLGVVFFSFFEKFGLRFVKLKFLLLRFILLLVINLRIKIEFIKFRFKKKRSNYINICLIYDIIIKIIL